MLRQIQSQTELDQLLAKNEHVLVYFWAAWNGPCRVLGKYLYEFDDDPTLKLYIAKINTDDYPDIATAYDIGSVPAILLFKHGQRVLAKQVVGVPPKEQLRVKLADLMHS